MEQHQLEYAVLVRPLSDRDGGGYVATVPDLPGCMSDGETVEEAIENIAGAVESWKEAAGELGRRVPVPEEAPKASGQWRQRVPRSLHDTLKHLARDEGVSLNTLVQTVLAEYAGRRRRGSDNRGPD